MKIRLKSFLFCICTLILLCPAVLSGCSTPPKSERQQFTGLYFDTVVQVTAWGASDEILEECEELCSRYERLFSRTIEDSDVSRINAAQGKPVEVDEETAALIQIGLDYGELSEGKFDITIGAVNSLWKFQDNTEKALPDPAALSEALSHVDDRNVKIEGNTVTLTDPQAQIDLGGIAKGYIADRLKEFLQDSGVEHALINLGGNVLALGGHYDGTPFEIGIQKPFAEKNEVLTTLEISDQSVVSSGNYVRYFEKDGKIYHHILDTATGYPCENDLLQVTILSDSSVDGDALSTTCYALGLEKGMEFIETLDGVEVIFVTDDGALHYTDK